MKKAILFSALLALIFTGCKSDEPQAKHQVTFRVPSLMVETEPMPVPRKVAPLTDDDGQQMTDLILFDGATYLTRQLRPEQQRRTRVTIESTDHTVGAFL